MLTLFPDLYHYFIKNKHIMNAQIRNNKILAIGEGVLDNGLNEVFPIDVEILPKTEQGELDYEAIFALDVEVINNEVKIKHDLDNE
jgi:hypothetical protein